MVVLFSDHLKIVTEKEETTSISKNEIFSSSESEGEESEGLFYSLSINVCFQIFLYQISWLLAYLS